MMKKNRLERLFFVSSVSVDIALLNVAFLFAFVLRFQGTGLMTKLEDYEELLIFSNIVWLIIVTVNRPYLLNRFVSEIQIIKRVLSITFWHALLITSFIILLKNYSYSRITLITFYTTLPVLLCLWKIIFLRLIRYLRSKGRHQYRIILMGRTQSAQKIKDFFMRRKEMGIQVTGVFDKQANEKLEIQPYEEAFDWIDSGKVDEVYCSVPTVPTELIEKLIRIADSKLLKVKIITDFSYVTTRKLECEFYNEVPVIKLSEIPLDNIYNRLVKRTFDVVFASLVFVLVLSWLIPIVSILICLESKGSPFFVQKRHGVKKHHFRCIKFRSMRINKEADTKQAQRKDARITRIGAFLRRTSIDEFPQFLNVLWGDMSVVGPRPHPIALDEKFRTVIDKFDKRHIVKPGVTGLAQIRGYRGETRKVYDMYGRVKLDRFYTENWSLALDVAIVFNTALKIFQRDQNAY